MISFQPVRLISKKKSGSAKQKKFHNARCLFRVEAKRLQDGWVTLKFIPEIQHGSETFRPTAGRLKWQMTTSQAKHPLYEQQFELTLNMGEMAMITSQGEAPHSLGTQFFTESKQDKEAVQRLLVVRLVDVATTKGIKTE